MCIRLGTYILDRFLIESYGAGYQPGIGTVVFHDFIWIIIYLYHDQ
jgi:hypothetical protein